MNISDDKMSRAWMGAAPTASPNPSLYLDTVRATAFAQSYKARSFESLSVAPGALLLDVGCGTGDDVLSLARSVGPAGKVIGLDKNPAIVAEASRRAANAGLPVEFQVGDACRMEFPDNSFDGCRSDRAVQHMDNPERAVAEMVRVLRPAKLLVITEPDWETLVIDPGQRSITRRVANFLCDQCVREGWIGRRLWAMYQRSGLIEISVNAEAFILTDLVSADRIWGLRRHALRAQQAGVISTAEMDAWWRELEAAHACGQFFSATVGFMARGRKPAPGLSETWRRDHSAA